MRNPFKKKKKEMKTLDTFSGLKVGMKIKVIGNSNGHSYPIDRELTLKKDGCAFEMSDLVKEVCGNNLKASDCILVSNLSIEDMEKELQGLRDECACLEAKITACKELGLTEYDETYCKVHAVLSVINNTTSDKEKAKIITSIIKGC